MTIQKKIMLLYDTNFALKKISNNFLEVKLYYYITSTKVLQRFHWIILM